MSRLERTQFIPQPRADVFAFFGEPYNLERITPPFLRFRIVTPPPIVLAPGTQIDYRLQLFGVPFGWRTRIESVEPGVHFVDRQVSGPYRRWRHRHTFHDVPGGTEMCDRVDYDVGWGPLGWAAGPLFVRRALRRIFDYRRDAVAGLLGVA
jgi:ligand-binding SRPBCC domain-containing protein